MALPVVPNLAAPIAVTFVDPTTGLPIVLNASALAFNAAQAQLPAGVGARLGTPTTSQAATVDIYNQIDGASNAPSVALSRYRRILNTTARKIAWVGDSTTALLFSSPVGGFSTTLGTSAATDYAYSLGAYPGGPFNNVTHLNFGDAGQTLANFVAGNASAGKNLSDVIAAAPDLIVFGYGGLNDVRLGTTTEAQLKALLISAISAIQKGLPNSDIVLRIANSILYDSTNTPAYIDVPVTLAKVQGYSDICYNACIEMVGLFHHLYVLDTRLGTTGIFTQISRAVSLLGTYMSDALHPNGEGYAAVVRDLAYALGPNYGDTGWPTYILGVLPLVPPVPTAMRLSQAYAASNSTPYLVDARSCEDPSHYNLVLAGQQVAAAGGSFLDIQQYNGLNSQFSGIIATGDIMQQFSVTTTTPGSQGEAIENGAAAWSLTTGGNFDQSTYTRLLPQTGYPLAAGNLTSRINIYRARPAAQKFNYDPEPNLNLTAADFTAGTLRLVVPKFSVIATITGVSTAVTTGSTIDLKKNGSTFATLTWANSGTTGTGSGTFFTANTRGIVFNEGDVLTAVVNAGFVSGTNLRINLSNK